MVNTPGSVRIAEWSPLATHALRDRGVPQPRRMWCLDHEDLARAPRCLERQSRSRASLHGCAHWRPLLDELERAFAEAVGPHAQRGAMAERTCQSKPLTCPSWSSMARAFHFALLRPDPCRLSLPARDAGRRRRRGRSRRVGHGGGCDDRRKSRRLRHAGGRVAAYRSVERGGGRGARQRDRDSPRPVWPPVRVRHRAASARLAPVSQVGPPC